MIDAYVVAVDDRVFLAVGFEVSANPGKVRQWECVQVVSRESGEPTTARTIAQIVTRNRSTVWGEDRADRCDDVAAAREPVSTSCSRLQQLAKIANTHSCRWHRHTQRIARAAKDRRAISLPVQREEEER